MSWGRRAPVVATVLGAVLAGGTVVAVLGTGPDETDTVVSEADATTPLPDLPLAASGARLVDGAGTTKSRTVSDTVGDTALTTADIESTTMSAAADGTVVARLGVAEWTALDSDDWRFGSTSVRWQIDTDGDGTTDAVVGLAADEDGPVAGVADGGGTVRCWAEPTTDQVSRSYEVSFSAACLGNPVDFRFRSRFEFDDVVFGLSDEDLGGDWSPALSNPAYVAPIVTVEPARLLDTRTGGGRRAAGSVTELVVAGRGGVASDARAVVLNVTAVMPSERGFVTVFPCGEERAETSNLNYVPGENRPNAVLAKVGDGGAVCLYTLRELDLVVDVNGFVPALSDVTAIPPRRLYDSRSIGGHRPAGSVTRVSVTDRAGVPPTADSVVLNVTAVEPLDRGYLTVYPCGDDVPLASNINYRAGETAPNAVLAKVGPTGEVCIFTLSRTHVVVDVNAYVPATSTVRSVEPYRVLDTREDGGVVRGDTVRRAAVLTAPGVPEDASGVVLNVTAVDPVSPGYVTVYPCGAEVPTASNLNYRVGRNIPNAVVAKVGAGGEVCLYVLSDVHLVVDVNGFVP